MNLCVHTLSKSPPLRVSRCLFPAGETSVNREEGNQLAHQGSPAAGDRGRGRLSSEAYLSRLVQDGHPSLLEIEKIRLGKKQRITVLE